MIDNTMFELTVILKDDERTFKQKFIIYELTTLSEKDPQIINCVKEAKKNFRGPVTAILKFSMEFQADFLND
jgi:hypothetical protein